jgi:DEAD/DEAH box helicase domain-containing protein
MFAATHVKGSRKKSVTDPGSGSLVSTAKSQPKAPRPGNYKAPVVSDALKQVQLPPESELLYKKFEAVDRVLPMLKKLKIPPSVANIRRLVDSALPGAALSMDDWSKFRAIYPPLTFTQPKSHSKSTQATSSDAMDSLLTAHTNKVDAVSDPFSPKYGSNIFETLTENVVVSFDDDFGKKKQTKKRKDAQDNDPTTGASSSTAASRVERFRILLIESLLGGGESSSRSEEEDHANATKTAPTAEEAIASADVNADTLTQLLQASSQQTEGQTDTGSLAARYRCCASGTCPLQKNPSSTTHLQLLQHLKEQPFYQDQIAACIHEEGQSAIFAEWPQAISPTVRRTLAQVAHINAPYSHQATGLCAVHAAMQKAPLHHADSQAVICTAGTSAGKSLLFVAPLLGMCERRFLLSSLTAPAPSSSSSSSSSSATMKLTLDDPLTETALLIFPTKALAADQHRALSALLRDMLPPHCDLQAVLQTYDHDAEKSARWQAPHASIVLTNPDMLHVGMLPKHASWKHWLAKLRLIVVDEAHYWTGLLGTHMTCVLRRLRRLTALYAARPPAFVLCSATMANPGEFSARLLGIPLLSITVIGGDSSLRGARDLLAYNPPLKSSGVPANREEAGGRLSVNMEAAALFAFLVAHGQQTLLFINSRSMSELLFSYAAEMLRAAGIDVDHCCAIYRGGYIPAWRRSMETRLHSGQLRGVVSTNALELGVDIGGMDAIITVGFPWSAASLRQQFGRAGRAGRASLAFLVAYDAALEQSLMRGWGQFWEKPLDAAVCNPGNLRILSQHLLCAKYESALGSGETEAPFFTPTGIEGMNDELLSLLDRIRQQPLGKSYPAASVNLRSTSNEGNFIVEDTQRAIVLEQADPTLLSLRFYPGAIVTYASQHFMVSDVDYVQRKVTCKAVNVNYYTEVVDNDRICVRNIVKQRRLSHAVVLNYGGVTISKSFVRYKKRHLKSGLVFETLQLAGVPSVDIESEAMWLTFAPPFAQGFMEQFTAAVREHSPSQRKEVEAAGAKEKEKEKDEDISFFGGLHALAHLLELFIPTLTMSMRKDIGSLVMMHDNVEEYPQLYLFDMIAGGSGVCEAAFDLIPTALPLMIQCLQSCACTSGCISCIYSPHCDLYNGQLHKGMAEALCQVLQPLFGVDNAKR